MNTETANIIYEAMPASGRSIPFIILIIVTAVLGASTVIFWKRLGIPKRCFLTFLTFISLLLVFIVGSQMYTIPFIVLIIAAVFSGVATVILWKKVGIQERCFFTFISLLLAFIVGSQIYVSFDAESNVYEKYAQGEYETVEGEITEYRLAKYDNQLDQFTVGEKEFTIPGFVSCWGYPIKQADGGALKDGMKVRICYVTYKFENVIMRLEILD